jgi:hypothetical protein
VLPAAGCLEIWAPIGLAGYSWYGLHKKCTFTAVGGNCEVNQSQMTALNSLRGALKFWACGRCLRWWVVGPCLITVKGYSLGIGF